ncbi:FMN-binding domain protein [uncultured archaeon]|nr:FMN-binding domain protein [uncultured archaeon]
MKKILLSLVLIALFTGYVIFQNSNTGKIFTAPAYTQTGKSNSTSDYSNNNSSQSITQSTPLPSITPTETPAATLQKYKDGQFIGKAVDVYYGNVQLKVTIQQGVITAVDFLQYPSDRRTSMMINMQAMPMLSSEAIQAQSAQVDGVSGASATSQGFQVSLADALSQATN